MPGEWQQNDRYVTDDEIAYRRVRMIPEHYQPVDPVSGLPQILNAALRYEDDGMSVYLDQFMEYESVSVDQLFSDETHAISRFEVHHARQHGAGILPSTDHADPNEARGRSHGLVRTAAPPPDKDRWKVLRNELRKRMSIRSSADTWSPVV
ncbi:hypothetical protein B7R22_17295 [Subtercola boreus]|uniref:Uncharacterized protein n=1 Tax=Subtercola boreus TaxID=120213 RepID=A0A3E0VS15_9MICO|nr:hypothetical protein B7R22_17295 [Subtercola boreus]